MSINQTAINETMAQFSRIGVHVHFDKELDKFELSYIDYSDKSLHITLGYDTVDDLLDEMNSTYHALCGGKYTVETTLSTSTEVSLYLAKIGIKNSRVYRDGIEISVSEFETENE